MPYQNGGELKMNMIKLLLIVFGVELTLIMLGIANFPFTSMYTFLTNPINWKTTDFLGVFSDLFLTLGIGATIVAGTVITRSDIFLFIGLASLFLSFGLPLANLFNIVAGQTNIILASILVSPIILIYVVTVVQFWRGRA